MEGPPELLALVWPPCRAGARSKVSGTRRDSTCILASGSWMRRQGVLGLRQANGLFAMLGSREEMEDAHLALPDFDPERGLSLFGVFDGHGGGPVLAGTSCRPSGFVCVGSIEPVSPSVHAACKASLAGGCHVWHFAISRSQAAQVFVVKRRIFCSLGWCHILVP